jgi:tRNA A37 threonylcarbamoyltransferase TsaD
VLLEKYELVSIWSFQDVQSNVLDMLQAFKFAVPMRKHQTCDFSYAGLKTSVRMAIEKQQQLFRDLSACRASGIEAASESSRLELPLKV